jgi:hypothetical protein
MSSNSERKTYKYLCEEYNAVIDEVDSWKQSLSINSDRQKMGLWNNSTYLDELLYIRQSIEKEMIPHQIVLRMKFYKGLEYAKNIPTDITKYIASFGDLIDNSALYFIKKGVDSTIDAVDPLC